MNRAIEEARKGTGLTYRNPLVGAVIVKNDQILAVGHHVGFGHAHAEVDAYQHVEHPEEVVDSTMYVTLEPCSHYGKTPPCAEQIVTWGVREVYVAQQDPNPLVSGRGIEYLCAHGVTVHVGLASDDACALNPAYNFFYKHRRPLVTVKVAQSLDGKIALRDDTRTYLTNSRANADVDQLRVGQQAILIGSDTALEDDPQLLVNQSVAYPPIRIVLDRRGRLQATARLHETQTAPLWVFTQNHKVQTNFTAENERVFVGEWTISGVMEALAKAGVQSLLVEGGSMIQAAFLQAGFVDRLVIYQVAELFGGNALPAFRQPQSGGRYAFHEISSELIGNARKSVFERAVD